MGTVKKTTLYIIWVVWHDLVMIYSGVHLIHIFGPEGQANQVFKEVVVDLKMSAPLHCHCDHERGWPSPRHCGGLCQLKVFHPKIIWSRSAPLDTSPGNYREGESRPIFSFADILTLENSYSILEASWYFAVELQQNSLTEYFCSFTCVWPSKVHLLHFNFHIELMSSHNTPEGSPLLL